MAGRRVRLWQRTGETYGHVLMKALITELRESVDERYRADGRLALINFADDIAGRMSSRRVKRVAEGWYTKIDV